MEIGHFQTHLSFCQFSQILDETYVVLLESCSFVLVIRQQQLRREQEHRQEQSVQGQLQQLGRG